VGRDLEGDVVLDTLREQRESGEQEWACEVLAGWEMGVQWVWRLGWVVGNW